MFEEFNTVDEKHEFEIVENGFILRVNGRGQDDNWLNKSYIFDGDVDFSLPLVHLPRRIEANEVLRC